MKFRIHRSGTLSLLRNEQWREAFCPFVAGELECGDWCALFGEPTATSNMTTTLQLCHRTLSCPTALFNEPQGGEHEKIIVP